MPKQEIARAKINDGKVSGNNFRFMPGRTGRDASDIKTLFRSLSYVRVLTEDDANSVPVIGAVVGPTKEVAVERIPGDPESVVIEKHAKFVPLTSVTDRADVVPIRNYVTPEDQKKPADKQLVKKFIDWASFKKLGVDDVRLVKYLGNSTINVEIWSGLFEPLTEEMYQLAGAILHGSIAYTGGKRVVKAKKPIIDPTSTEIQTVARTMAKLVNQAHGEVLGGVPLWTINTWEIQYSAKDSEMVLARHFGVYYLVEVQGGESLVITKYTGAEAAKWHKRFDRMLGEQLHEKQERAKIDAALGATEAAA